MTTSDHPVLPGLAGARRHVSPQRIPSVRLRIDLSEVVADALTRLSIREERTFERQAHRLLTDGLRRAGELPPNNRQRRSETDE